MELGLGPLAVLSLADARQEATVLRMALLEGRDPKAERTRKRAERRAATASVITFDQDAER